MAGEQSGANAVASRPGGRAVARVTGLLDDLGGLAGFVSIALTLLMVGIGVGVFSQSI